MSNRSTFAISTEKFQENIIFSLINTEGMIQGNDCYIFNCSSSVNGRAEHKALGKSDFKEG